MTKPVVLPARLLAVEAVMRVLAGESLMGFSSTLKTTLPTQERAAYQALCFGVLRHLRRLDWLLDQLLEKPLRNRDRDVELLLLTGLFELIYHQRPEHAVVGECVEHVKRLPRAKQRPWAKGLCNAVLRRFVRERQTTLEALARQPLAVRYSLPDWLFAALKADWPEHLPELLAAQQCQAPMFLRVNALRMDTEAYRQQLAALSLPAERATASEHAIRLASPQSVEALPGFAQGSVAVQDLSAQVAAEVLAPRPNERVLDACCAPGGKTAHLWALGQGQIELHAADSSESRLRRCEENFARLGVAAQVHCLDLASPELPFAPQSFDAILLDAPCSGTGVIRRHPDIKHLRRQSDIAALAQLQARLLERCWSLLKPGGRLLYCTCSILKQENQQQIAAFVANCGEAQHQPLALAQGQAGDYGWQVLPEAEGGDGFYYALLTKSG